MKLLYLLVSDQRAGSSSCSRKGRGAGGGDAEVRPSETLLVALAMSEWAEPGLMGHPWALCLWLITPSQPLTPEKETRCAWCPRGTRPHLQVRLQFPPRLDQD